MYGYSGFPLVSINLSSLKRNLTYEQVYISFTQRPFKLNGTEGLTSNRPIRCIKQNKTIDPFLRYIPMKTNLISAYEIGKDG